MKFVAEMPPNKWLSYKEIVSMGYSRVTCTFMLPSLHGAKQIEVRPQDDSWNGAIKAIEEKGFCPETIMFHEYRISRNGRPRRLELLRNMSFAGALQPISTFTGFPPSQN